jgi:bifunctional UDP-N-acetylglucosamine pyrophosphorylase/glucosamine-1-phosphate N-acetyltransferase
MTRPTAVVVLAAGKGTRMKASRPKVLHTIAGRTLIGHVLAAARGLAPVRTVVVLGEGMDEVARALAADPLQPEIVVQEPRLGTGHALMVAHEALPTEGNVLVLYGDTPLLTPATLATLLGALEAVDAAVAVQGMRPPETAGYGRLAFGPAGGLEAIVEERHADEALKRDGICNAGIMAFDAARLPVLLEALELRPEKGEYYLTDTVAHARARDWACAAIEGPWQDGVGVNSQSQLAAAEALMQARLRAFWMDEGVTLRAPETVFMCADTELASDVELGPNVVIGPAVRIAHGARVLPFSHLEGVTIGEQAEVGPFARLRPGARIDRHAKVGNFVEIKNAEVEPGAKVNHLTYIGDARIGADTNVGAGTITCNYDGFNKHWTNIGAGAFIGSNTSLVAPVTVGDRAIIGAGSTITQDVPADALSVARGRQRDLTGGAIRVRERNRHAKERKRASGD